MKVFYLNPANRISEYVQEILILEDHSITEPYKLPLFANGMPTLVFQTRKGYIKNSYHHLTLFGQTVVPDVMTINDHFTLIAYFLKPYTLISLFGISAQELTDNPIDLTLLSHCDATALQEQLLNADSTEAMIFLLDEYLFDLSTKIKADTRLIQYATNEIGQNPYTEILKEVQSELCVTERTFQRMFHRNVGISPNQFRRICQFNNAFRQLNRAKNKNLTDIAFANCYADQSHYIRAFKEFTNVTPLEYLAFGRSSV